MQKWNDSPFVSGGPEGAGGQSADSASGFSSYLVDLGLLSLHDAERAKEGSRRTGQRIDAVISELGLLPEAALLRALSEYFSIPLTSPDEVPPAPDLVGLDTGFLERNQVLPLGFQGAALVVAISDPFRPDIIASIGYFTERPVEARLMRQRDLAVGLAAVLGKVDAAEVPDVLSSTLLGDLDVERLRDAASEAPIVRLVTRLFSNAVQDGASDVHIEPRETEIIVRYRIDGVLIEVERLSIDIQASVATRIKILARLNISERRMPQDGRIKLTVAGRDIDVRISCVPTQYGESLVMRLLDTERGARDFNQLGIEGGALATIEKLIGDPNGIVLVTGPTGSGKTTTLYSALQRLNRPEIKVFSVEDPVEYELAGVNQMQVKREIGLDFVHALRAILRQDPDVIMVGEIRDVETARIAIQASLTGHLVLSTLHTNSAAASITRLLDMGVEDYLLASSLTGVVAQRLVRRLCPACATDRTDGSEVVRHLGLNAFQGRIPFDLTHTKKAVGCSKCRGTGFAGRTAITETLVVTDDLREHIIRRSGDREIERLARAAGMETLIEAGLRKVAAGITTIEEVLRVARG